MSELERGEGGREKGRGRLREISQAIFRNTAPTRQDHRECHVVFLTPDSLPRAPNAGRYSEVPINSSACIYHILMKLPFSTWGENFAVLIQNLTIVGLVWLWETPRVKWTEIVGMTAAFIALCAIQFSLPPALYPWLMYINLPLGISSNLPQIVTNFRQKHTGQVAVVSNILKFIGCSVRIFTTLTQIGLDAGLIANYSLGATMNVIIVAQCWIYRKRVSGMARMQTCPSTSSMETQIA